MEDCIFCKIIAGEIPSSKVYEDDHWFAFRDIEPCAPVHVLLIPKKHVKNILAMDEAVNADFSDFFLVVKKIAEQEGLTESGFRLVVNCGEHPYSISTRTSSAGKNSAGRPSRKENKRSGKRARGKRRRKIFLRDGFFQLTEHG